MSTETQNEKELALLAHVQQTAESTPESVLSAIDAYCYDNHWMMHIGDKKATVITNVLKTHQPKSVLELGTYCGYSTVHFASHLPADGKITTIDPSDVQTTVAKQIIKKAGVEDKVIFINKTSQEGIEELATKGEKFDLVFIDHLKSLYYQDIKRIVELGLVKPGGVVVADNVIMGNTVEYLEFVRKSGKFKSSELFEGTVEYSEKVDGIEVSVLA